MANFFCQKLRCSGSGPEMCLKRQIANERELKRHKHLPYAECLIAGKPPKVYDGDEPYCWQGMQLWQAHPELIESIRAAGKVRTTGKQASQKPEALKVKAMGMEGGTIGASRAGTFETHYRKPPPDVADVAREAVKQNDNTEAKEKMKKTCNGCGQAFEATDGRQKKCPACKAGGDAQATPKPQASTAPPVVTERPSSHAPATGSSGKRLCSKGCGKQAKKDGLCSVHYTEKHGISVRASQGAAKTGQARVEGTLGDLLADHPDLVKALGEDARKNFRHPEGQILAVLYEHYSGGEAV